MILGVGIDIEEIRRFIGIEKNERFLDIVFTGKEIKYCMSKKNSSISFAGKFCAKEAVMKAYPKKIFIKDIEILNEKGGRPRVYIKGVLKRKISCSISHTKTNAVAYVAIES